MTFLASARINNASPREEIESGKNDNLKRLSFKNNKWFIFNLLPKKYTYPLQLLHIRRNLSDLTKGLSL